MPAAANAAPDHRGRPLGWGGLGRSRSRWALGVSSGALGAGREADGGGAAGEWGFDLWPVT
jgi:hypothetical protein